MTSEISPIIPDWPSPANVRAACTTRCGGVSSGAWTSLNLGSHVQDRQPHVLENRRRVASWAGLSPENFGWLEQVHGTDVCELPAQGTPQADASITAQPNIVCSILTADCLPVLFCNRQGTQVAAAHAGWRGLCAGVLDRTVAAFACPPGELMAWMGPAIGPNAFEVGEDVRSAFARADARSLDAFVASPGRPGHYLADLYQLARQNLSRVGIDRVYGGDFCTVSDANRFYSYRRDGITGRMASFIWFS